MNSHLLLNHLIVIMNCWDDAAIPMLFYKIESEYWSYLMSFLIYLNRVPDYPYSDLNELVPDLNILKILKGI